MRCPYCSNEMKPCAVIPYRGPDGLKITQWARCGRCQHASIVSPARGARATA